MTTPAFEEVRAFILNTVAPAAAAENGVDGMHLIDAGILDSVGFVNLIAAIENRFGVEVDFGEADPDEFLTVGGLARCVSASAQSQPDSPHAR